MNINAKRFMFLFIAAAAAYAAEARTAADTSAVRNAGKDFNALEYSSQKRYRPDNDRFISEGFFDNTFISAFVGAQQIAPIESTTFCWGPVAGISFGKWFDPFSGIRLSASGNVFARNWDNRKPLNAGADLSYLFNITSYLDGYRMSRFCDLYTVAGAGYRASWLGGNVSHVGNIHAGFSLNMKTGKHIDLFVEPLVYLYSDGLAHTGEANWRRYNFSYGAQAGLKLNFIPEEGQRPSIDYTEGTFISFSAGLQFQNTPYYRSTGKFLGSTGPQFLFSYGKWYTDICALRTSLLWSGNVWNSDGRYKLNSRYIGGRVEAMFDMIGIFLKDRENPVFSFYTIFGPEAGLFRKVDRTRDIAYPYLGLGAGMQFKFRMIDCISIYAEPHVSAIPYSYVVPTINHQLEGWRHNFCDWLFNLDIGLEISLF